MDARQKKLIRAVIIQVHPDVLAKHPLAQLQNSESLKVIMPHFRGFLCRSTSLTRALCLDLLQLLNTYIDQLSRGGPLSQQTIRFFTVNSKFTNTVDITLPASGSLAPLFNAFGLIENEELDIQQAVDPGRLQQTCLQKHVLLNFIRLMMLHVVQTFMLLLWL